MSDTLTNLAIIMDGNGRWAKDRNKPRSFGHEQGAKNIKEITAFCAKHTTIKTVTLYAFSTENWKRPKVEIDFLMQLLGKYLTKELATYHAYKIKFETIGDLSKFSDELQKKIQYTKDETKNYTNLTQILALNYGFRDEMVRSVKKLIAEKKEINEANIANSLDTAFGDVDLLIRTGGERRLSNFLLWQSAYAEIFFTKTLWPDFNKDELSDIIEKYLAIERKFGGLK